MAFSKSYNGVFQRAFSKGYSQQGVSKYSIGLFQSVSQVFQMCFTKRLIVPFKVFHSVFVTGLFQMSCSDCLIKLFKSFFESVS